MMRGKMDNVDGRLGGGSVVKVVALQQANSADSTTKHIACSMLHRDNILTETFLKKITITKTAIMSK